MNSDGFRIALRTAAVALATTAVLFVGPATPDAQARAPRYAGQQMLVKFKTGATGSHQHAAVARINAPLRAPYSTLALDQIAVPARIDLARAAELLPAHPA